MLSERLGWSLDELYERMSGEEFMARFILACPPQPAENETPIPEEPQDVMSQIDKIRRARTGA